MKESHFTEEDRALIIKLSVQLERAIADIAEIKSKYERREEDFVTKNDINNFVTQDQFSPVKKLVYGATGLILTGVVSALIYLVIRY